MDVVSLIKKHITHRLQSLETVQIVIVEAVDYENYTCSVKPKAKANVRGKVFDLPIITGVPIAMQKSGGSVILVPPKVGDIGIVIFSKNALDTLLINRDTVSILIPRNFDITDAIYAGGLYTGLETVPTIAEGEMILHHESGTAIKFTTDGKIYITG